MTQPHKEKNYFKFFYNTRLWLCILRNRYSKDKKKGKFLISSISLKTDKNTGIILNLFYEYHRANDCVKCVGIQTV